MTGHHPMRTWVLAAWALAASALLYAEPGDEEDVAAVGRCFADYRSALLKPDGKAAAGCISSGTIKLYQDYRDHALKSDEATVKKLSIGNRMQVLLLRHRVDLATLKEMDGASVFAYAVDKGWIGKDGVVRATIGDIAIGENRATGKLSAEGGSPARGTMHFAREAEGWKIDLGPLMMAVDQLLQADARRKGLDENAFLFSILSSISGRKVTDEIWKPLE